MIYPRQYDIAPEGGFCSDGQNMVEVCRDKTGNIDSFGVWDAEGDEITLTESSARKLIAALQHALSTEQEEAA